MADTGRDVTADNRSAILLSVKSEEPEYFTSLLFSTSYDSCQGVDHGILECLAHTVHLIQALHAIGRGSTVSLTEGNLLGTPRFAVSIYPTKTVQFSRTPTVQQLSAFIALNLNTLTTVGHAVGSWIDPKSSLHVLDIVVCPSNRILAMELGWEANQRSIFDLLLEREITIRANPSVGKLGGPYA